MATPGSSRIIVAVTGENDRYDAVRTRAAEMAAAGDMIVILYDIDAAGIFASPVPTGWSGQGEAELMAEESRGERLDADALETAGRGPIARQVRSLRSAGVDAWGWLPTTKDVSALAAYAEGLGASVVLIPTDMVQPGLADPVRGIEGTGQAEGTTSVAFETVGD